MDRRTALLATRTGTLAMVTATVDSCGEREDMRLETQAQAPWTVAQRPSTVDGPLAVDDDERRRLDNVRARGGG